MIVWVVSLVFYYHKMLSIYLKLFCLSVIISLHIYIYCIIYIYIYIVLYVM